MTSAPVTVVDRISFTCSVSPEQAAAYCRRHPRLAGWRERQWAAEWPRGIQLHIVLQDPEPARGQCKAHACIMIPMHATFSDYSRRMAELCDALVRLGCAERPSEILLGMGEERL